jgi:hypothetical protein
MRRSLPQLTLFDLMAAIGAAALGLALVTWAVPFGIRAYRVRAILALDRMRAHNLSSDDILQTLRPTTMASSNYPMKNVEVMSVSPAQLDQATGQPSQTVEYVLSWAAHHNNPEQYENLIVKASPDGEILRIKDVAKFERGSSFYIYTSRGENFSHIGHTLFALLAALVGGVLCRRLRSVSVRPEVPTEGE